MFEIVEGPEISVSVIINISVVITAVTVDNDACPLLSLANGGHRINLSPGQTTRFTAELHNDEGNIIDISPDFSLPITGLFGQAGRTFAVNFVNGQAEFGINWPASGEWEVTQEAMNAYIDNSAERYLFSGLAITISESTV